MKDVDGLREPHRVDGAKGMTVEVHHHLEHPGVAEPLQGFAAGDLRPICASQRAPPTLALTSFGNALRSSLLEATQRTGFGADSGPVFRRILILCHYRHIGNAHHPRATKANTLLRLPLTIWSNRLPQKSSAARFSRS